MSEPVRVLVVDDSSFFRKRIRHCLEETPAISVVGEAANGEEALRLAKDLSPDLITMDVAMPVMDGITAVRQIMQVHPTRIIMFSALTQDGARATLEALDAGAVDFLPKIGAGEDSGSQLRNRVLEIGGKAMGRNIAHPSQVSRRSTRHSAQNTELVVIGASTGGPMAVQDVIARLPQSYPLPVLVVVHMPKMFTGTYAERLQDICAVNVQEARDGMRLIPGQVLIAPGGQQTEVHREGQRLCVKVSDAGDHLFKPSVDVTFRSAARHVGAGVLGIVLTGMGTDGSEGAKDLKRSSARIWAQDEATSVVYGMPAAVARNGTVDKVLPLPEIAKTLLEETT